MRSEHQAGSFDGVVQIILYNWPFYAVAFIFNIVVAAILFLHPTPAYRILLYAAAGFAIFWTCSSLLVSHYVYDRSCLYQWNWLKIVLKQDAGSWVNVHSGLDQTSRPLLKIFPAEQHRSIDIYLPSQMTEPSIARARRRAQADGVHETANSAALPLADCAWDTVFLIFAAHELRSRDAKAKLFAEIHRALKPRGRVVLVEHLRDWKNFLAYGPGFLHFFSAREWITVFDEASLKLVDQRWITPFVRCFVLGKQDMTTNKASVELHDALERG